MQRGLLHIPRLQACVDQESGADRQGHQTHRPSGLAPSATGRSVAVVTGVLLLCAIFLPAAHSAPSFTSSAFDMELLLLAQLAAIAGWLAVKPES